jgi:hypothetical protein
MWKCETDRFKVSQRNRVKRNSGTKFTGSSAYDLNADSLNLYIPIPEMSFYDSFDGPGRKNNVNLSTASTTSSTTLISKVRAERLIREEARRQSLAANRIQRVWRGHVAGRHAREQLLSVVEAGMSDYRDRTRGLVVLLRGGLVDLANTSRIGKLLEAWCTEGVKMTGESTGGSC